MRPLQRTQRPSCVDLQDLRLSDGALHRPHGQEDADRGDLYADRRGTSDSQDSQHQGVIGEP